MEDEVDEDLDPEAELAADEDGGDDGEASAVPSLEGLLGEGFDWIEVVRAYPIPALLLAAVGGFVLGRTRGQEIVEALSEFAAGQVSRHVNEVLGEELL